MLLLGSTFVSALLTISSASPLADVSTAYALKSSHHVPRKWLNLGPAPPDHIINLQIGLRNGRFGEILGHLDEGKKLNLNVIRS